MTPQVPELNVLNEKRERVFIILAAFFIGSMTLLNVVGITRFIQMGPLSVAVGVLPYPLTFLCTDLISELYGKKRASFVVWIGFFLNLFMIVIVLIGFHLPSVDASVQPPWQTLFLSQPVHLANGEVVKGSIDIFHIIYSCTVGSVFASMMAYLAAQFCDVHLFHFWKELTRGKHLWLRNNFSTMVSQLVDSFMVIIITFGAVWWRGEMGAKELVI
ncbi:MAG: queuosine precursor transporter, partial [Bdellovibrionales bacterium]|nr:queuosine precursor transporter [Bdellovibrionales bacterium]